MRPHRWLIAAISRIVPRGVRAEWRQEWNAELHHREVTIEQWHVPTLRDRIRLLRHSSGAVWDAIWLTSSRWQSARFLIKHWRVSLAAALSIGVAMAATIAALDVYDALLLRPPGVEKPEALVTLFVRSASTEYGALSVEDYRYYHDNAHAFASVAAFPMGISSAYSSELHEFLISQSVSENYFDVLGVRPRLGLLAAPTGAGASTQLVVISEALWRRLGADPGIVGHTLRLDRSNFTVFGVAPATFTGMNLVWRTDVWFPFVANSQGGGSATPPDRTDRQLFLVGRLAHGVTIAQAQAEVTGLSTGLAAQYPQTDKDRKAFLTPTTTIPADSRRWVAPMLGAVIGLALLTLIAAGSNVTNLLLGVAITRRHEMLVRSALGGSRLQLMLPLLRESLVLALTAGGLGLAVAYAGLTALSTWGLSKWALSFGPGVPPPSIDLRPDVAIAGSTVVLACVVGLAIGLMPACRAAADGLSGALNRELDSTGKRRTRLRSALVVVQTAVVTMVLVGAGLAWRSAETLRRVDLGLASRDFVAALVPLDSADYTPATGRQFYQRIRKAAAAVPDVDSVSLASSVPIVDCCNHVSVRNASESAATPAANFASATVDDHYFSTLGIAVLAGRTFDDVRDTPKSQEVVVVSHLMAERRWPHQNPVGQRLRIDEGSRLAEVIGVVADAKYQDIDEVTQPMLYDALSQHYQEGVEVIARTAGDASAIVPGFRLAINGLSSNLDFLAVRTLMDGVGNDLMLPNLIFMALASLGALALLLTAVGLYGTVFYAVGQRRTEIGIRVALGARPRDVLSLVLRHTVILAAIGSAIGAGLSLVLIPIVSSMFYGVRSIQVGVLSTVVLASVGLSALVAYLAARPWTRISAIEILRAP